MLRTLSAAAVAALVVASFTPAALAGPLDPPVGPIASTHKTLTEVEPRTPISAATTPGDASCSFRITQPGSYYLTRTLTGESGKFGIAILAGGVTLDLNGFELVGVPGSLDGVVTLVEVVDVEVRNGSVRNWGEDGVDLAFFPAFGSRVVDVRAVDNGVSGMRLSNASSVHSCSSHFNAQAGIDVGQACTVVDCTVSVNAGVGIVAANGGTITGCNVYGNGSDGVQTGSVCSVTGCTIYNNELVGINAFSACTVSGNVVRSNGTDGIQVFGASMVLNNTSVGNGQKTTTGAGILAVGTDNRIEGNNCISQDYGIRSTGSRNLIIRNSCSGNSTNWELAVNNIYGPIIDRSAAVTGAVSGNAAASALGSTDPNANFTY